MVKVGILAGTAYSGIELVRILSRHPEAEIVSVTGRSSAGKALNEVFPHLGSIDLTVTEELDESVDVVFSALPHGASAERLGPLVEAGVKAVDISADFRLAAPEEYRQWYGEPHPFPEYLGEAVYGLPELSRDDIASARLVANPGCYPTASILGLAPAVKAGIVDLDIIVDAKSGVSGAGQKVTRDYMYSEVNENLRAYGLGGHFHLPEMTQELGKLAGPIQNMRMTFVPHLVPMTRGILATCYATLKEDVVGSGELAANAVREVYQDFYRDESFVEVTDSPPMTKQTLGNNTCLVHPVVDPRTNRLIVISCIDNLVKGAAGQAVQNMNLMFGLPEDEGLKELALYP